MTTISHVRGCEPMTMATYGRALKASNRTFTTAVNGMQSAVDRTMLHWQGSAASAATGRAWSEKVAATMIDDVVARLADAHIAWGPILNGIRDAVLRIADSARSAGMTVADDGTITPPAVPVINGDVVTQQLAQQNLNAAAGGLEHRLKKELQNFEKAEKAASRRINLAANLLYELRKRPTTRPSHQALTPGARGGNEYVFGSPVTPKFVSPDDYKWNSKRPTSSDRAKADMLNALPALGWWIGLDDGTAMYSHFRGNTGRPKEFDFSEAYREDKNIRKSVDNEIILAARAADERARNGHTNFSMTGDPRDAGGQGDNYDPRFPYADTQNWQKAVGSYQQWSHSNVRVEGTRVYMDITVEADDRYNFNKGARDIGFGVPDSVNGRLEEVGWAKPFDSHGTVTKTVSWELGHPPTTDTGAQTSGPQRDTWGEDRNGARTRPGR